MTSIEHILSQLIAFSSITPEDNGCQKYMINLLQNAGFEIEEYSCPPVSNFFAYYGSGSPLLVFAGHTDVVPVGDLNKWDYPPFQLTKKNDQLYGRGTADMKGSLAAMLRCALRFVQEHSDFNGRLGFLITSGEEGDLFELGTPYVMKKLAEQNINIDYCIVGEPSSIDSIGDMIKIGRRGSLSGRLILHGKQGHVAYPHLADNPIHKIAPVLHELAQVEWDKGNEHFPPTSLQITHIQSGGHAGNIIPGDLSLHFNFRYSTEQTAEQLKEKMLQFFIQHHLQPEITWQHNGMPFLTAKGLLLAACSLAIEQICQITPELSTSGGTSDGRFIAPYGVEVIELGPVNATIHQVNEWTSLAELEKLEAVYYEIIQRLLTDRG